MRLYRLQFLIVALLLAVPLVGAQDTAADTTRDPVALAQRLLGFDADYTIPPLPPRYSPGDTAESWGGKAGRHTPRQSRQRHAHENHGEPCRSQPQSVSGHLPVG